MQSIQSHLLSTRSPVFVGYSIPTYRDYSWCAIFTALSVSILSLYIGIILFGTSRKDSGVLYRIEQTKEGFLATIKSSENPVIENSNLFKRYKKSSTTCELSKYYSGLKAGDQAKFRLEAFPCYSFFKEGKKNPTKRVITNPLKRKEWLEKKFESSGLELVKLHINQDKGQKMIGKGGSNVGFFKTYDFRGTVIVKDEQLLSKALESGIGPEKAYGAGLLTLY